MARTKQTERKSTGGSGKRIATFGDYKTPSPTKRSKLTEVSTNQTLPTFNYRGTVGTIGNKWGSQPTTTKPGTSCISVPTASIGDVGISRTKPCNRWGSQPTSIGDVSISLSIKPATSCGSQPTANIGAVAIRTKPVTANSPPANDPTVKPVTKFKTKATKCIWLKKGNIAQTQVDVIVNITNPELVLDGAVANSILLAAGQQVQDECDLLVGRSYGNNQLTVPVGQFKTTGAGHMPRCKGIYHAVCPPYAMDGSEAIMSSLVYNLLVEAHNQDMRSIAFPAIGSGQAGFPPHVIARILCQEIIRFSAQFPQSDLYDLRFVVHWHDDKVYKAFQYELGVCTKEQQQVKASEKTPMATPATKSQPPTTATNTQTLENNNKASTSSTLVDLTTDHSQDDPIIILDSPDDPSSSNFFSPCNSPNFISLSPSADSPGLFTLPPGMFSGQSSQSSSQASPDGGKPIKFDNFEYHELWGTSQMWMETVSVQLTTGDLVDASTDAIVVQTSDRFDLKGHMASVVLNKGGSSIAQQCRWKSKNLHGSEKVMCTSAGTLLCSKIIFVALTDTTEVKQRIIDVLNEAENEGLRSIAIPALGTGELGGLPSRVASDILDGIGEFIAKTNPQSVDRIKLTILDPFVESAFKPVFKSKVNQSYGFRKEKGKDRLQNNGGSPLRAVGSLEEEMYSQTDLGYDSEAMGTLNSEKLKQINACAAKHKVTVTTKPYGHGHRHVKSLKLEGPRLQVFFAKSDIQDLYLKLQKQYSEQKQAQKLCENVQWKWFDKVANRFVDYDIEVAAELEKAYLENKLFVEPSQLGKFRVDLVTMKEINLGGGLPVKETSVQRISKKGPELQSNFPRSWTNMDSSENLKVVDVQPSTSEYQTVEAAFISNLYEGERAGYVGYGAYGERFKVTRIQRIQNKELYRQYQARKESMQLSLNGRIAQIEMSLYHGTAATSCTDINMRGFNRSYQRGMNAFGNGTYFARDAGYSASSQYSAPDRAGHKRMYLCKVLTGEYTNGRQGMQVLPKKPGLKNEIYNSLVDNTHNPSIFVIFHDAQAYPEYLITFC